MKLKLAGPIAMAICGVLASSGRRGSHVNFFPGIRREFLHTGALQTAA